MSQPPPLTATDGTAAPPGQLSFRRQRAPRACRTCHARKVRCDAALLGVPCTNCVAFQIECRIPSPRRKRGQSGQSPDPDSDHADSSESKCPPPLQPPYPPPLHPPYPPPLHPPQPGTAATEAAAAAAAPNTTTAAGTTSPSGSSSSTTSPPPRPPPACHSARGTPITTRTEAQSKQEEEDSGTFLNLVVKPKFTRAPITEAGRVAFLGESSNLTLLVHDRQGSADVVHYPLPENMRGSRSRMTEMDQIEIDILNQRGAFLLPPRALCDEVIDAYFRWIHPIMPIINRTRFMRQYADAANPPSLLLLQAVLLAGSRVCNSAQLMDANGSTTPAALTFYKRAKALYDANYEDDRVTIVQALLLMGWYWEGPEDSTANTFYYSRVATIVAQGSGMHRSVDASQLSTSDKRLWKRIWWTLFTRDRSVAVALGRPVHINLDDSDVEMVTEEDFIEDEAPDQAGSSPYPPDPVHVQFFLQYVKLCEIMGLVLSQQYSVASKGRPRNAIDLTHSDMALADWLQNCPKCVYWDMEGHHFWSGLLHSNYYTTLCLLHRAHMPPHGAPKFPDAATYPSRNIAFQAAAMITAIIENLAAHDQLKYCPAFVVYSLFSALIMHVYQMRSPVPQIQQATQERLNTCMESLKEVSRVWLVGKMVYRLFESILGNKGMKERLQQAGGRRQKRAQQAFSRLEQQLRIQNQQVKSHDHPKRKYDDMAIDFGAGTSTPTPQESYERSRPQTPSFIGKNDTAGQEMQRPVSSSPQQAGRQPLSDTFMGGPSVRPGPTRPSTPFFPLASTPPDLYLVTRNSPNLSQSVWENFQPDLLFPESTALPSIPPASPQPPYQHNLDTSFVDQVPMRTPSQDPSPFRPGTSTGDPPQGSNAGSHTSTGYNQGGSSVSQPAAGYNNQGHEQLGAPPRAQLAFEPSEGQSPESWSTGSSQGPGVPTTLNVEDWFQFFGINGDMGQLFPDLPLP